MHDDGRDRDDVINTAISPSLEKISSANGIDNGSQSIKYPLDDDESCRPVGSSNSEDLMSACDAAAGNLGAHDEELHEATADPGNRIASAVSSSAHGNVDCNREAVNRRVEESRPLVDLRPKSIVEPPRNSPDQQASRQLVTMPMNYVHSGSSYRRPPAMLRPASANSANNLRVRSKPVDVGQNIKTHTEGSVKSEFYEIHVSSSTDC